MDNIIRYLANLEAQTILQAERVIMDMRHINFDANIDPKKICNQCSYRPSLHSCLLGRQGCDVMKRLKESLGQNTVGDDPHAIGGPLNYY